MNRQMRRAQEKSDKKRERETDKRKTARRALRENKRESRRSDTTSSTPRKRRPVPRRFTGYMALLTAALIPLQAFRPPDADNTLFGVEINPLIIDAMFYGLLGYFVLLWLLRSSVKGALWITVALGLAMSIFVEVVKFYRADIGWDPLMLLYALLALAAGMWLARVVARAS